MHVLLLNASFMKYGGVRGHGGKQIPLNLCYLAAYAREKHPSWTFRILDAEAEGLSHEQTVQQAVDENPDVIGITANTCVFDSILDLTLMLKQRLPEVKIVLGGPHPSALPQNTLADAPVDFAVMGEGELTFEELLVALDKNREEFQDIQGLVYRTPAGEIIVNAPRPLTEDLDQFPFPARDLVNNDLYFAPPTKSVGTGPSTLISTSRGCPCNCGFCSAQNVWTRRLRVRSPKNVVDELQECVEKYKISTFNFADEFFTAIKPRAMEICAMILERGLKIRWVCSARAQQLDEETLRAMKRAGCRELSFGIESGNQNILSLMQKGTDLEEIRRVIKRTKKVGLKTHAGYIIGYPGETEETIQDTVNFARELNTDIAAFWIASPLPGSDLYLLAKQKGYLRTDAKWADYSPLSNNRQVMQLPNLSPERVRFLHRKALRQYYFRPGYILRRLTMLRRPYEIKNLFSGLATLLHIK